MPTHPAICLIFHPTPRNRYSDQLPIPKPSTESQTPPGKEERRDIAQTKRSCNDQPGKQLRPRHRSNYPFFMFDHGQYLPQNKVLSSSPRSGIIRSDARDASRHALSILPKKIATGERGDCRFLPCREGITSPKISSGPPPVPFSAGYSRSSDLSAAHPLRRLPARLAFHTSPRAIHPNPPTGIVRNRTTRRGLFFRPRIIISRGGSEMYGMEGMSG